jgi:hypothetical protein
MSGRRSRRRRRSAALERANYVELGPRRELPRYAYADEENNQPDGSMEGVLEGKERRC